jgi:hypothetical protein
MKKPKPEKQFSDALLDELLSNQGRKPEDLRLADHPGRGCDSILCRHKHVRQLLRRPFASGPSRRVLKHISLLLESATVLCFASEMA